MHVQTYVHHSVYRKVYVHTYVRHCVYRMVHSVYSNVYRRQRQNHHHPLNSEGKETSWRKRNQKTEKVPKGRWTEKNKSKRKQTDKGKAVSKTIEVIMK